MSAIGGKAEVIGAKADIILDKSDGILLVWRSQLTREQKKEPRGGAGPIRLGHKSEDTGSVYL